MGHNMISSCHTDLRELSDTVEYYENLLGEFMSYFASPDPIVPTLREWQPRLIWGQVQAAYPHLSRVLYNVYRAPASTAAVE